MNEHLLFQKNNLQSGYCQINKEREQRVLGILQNPGFQYCGNVSSLDDIWLNIYLSGPVGHKDILAEYRC